MIAPIDREPAEKGRRNERMARELANSLCRQFGEVHGRRRERVVAHDRAVRQDEDERRRYVLAGILPRLNPEISIERLYATLERGSVVLWTEYLDSRCIATGPTHRSDTGYLAITTHRVAQAIVHGRRIEQGFHECLAVTQR